MTAAVRDTARAAFAGAIRRLLRPVVRQLIEHGITYPAMTRLLKELYVEVAEADFALPFKRLTDSRVSLLTGIHRKEVVHLRRRARPEPPAAAVEDTLLTHVLGRWMAGPPYADRDGTPRPLRYEALRRRPSFSRLVREISADIPVRSVLDELLRQGAVALSPAGEVTLVRGANIPQDDVAAKLALLGTDPAELFQTIAHNIAHPDAPRFQRKVVYDNIGSEALEAVRRAARELGEEFIRRANVLLAAHDRDRNPGAPGGARTRVVLGAHYFEEPFDPSPPTAAEPPPPGRIRRSR